MRGTGTVERFNESEGFGLIAPEDSGEDCFAHPSAIQGDGFKTVNEGQRVELARVQGAEGPAAENAVWA